MTDTLPATIDQQLPARTDKRGKPLKVSAKVADALRLMVEEGIQYAEAAERVGMHVRAMRKALEQPHVVSHLRQARQVFRGAVNARNILRLAQIRDAGDNMPAVQAVRLLEQLDGENDSTVNGLPRTPGVTIVLQQLVQQVGEHVEIEHNPLTLQDDGRNG